MVELNAIHEVNNVVGGRYRLPMKLSVSVSYKGGETYKEKALVDTGNLITSGVAISGTMARQLRLPIVPEQVVVGTAKKRQRSRGGRTCQRDEDQSKWGWQFCGQPPGHQEFEYQYQFGYWILDARRISS